MLLLVTTGTFNNQNIKVSKVSLLIFSTLGIEDLLIFNIKLIKKPNQLVSSDIWDFWLIKISVSLLKSMELNFNSYSSDVLLLKVQIGGCKLEEGLKV